MPNPQRSGAVFVMLHVLPGAMARDDVRICGASPSVCGEFDRHGKAAQKYADAAGVRYTSWVDFSPMDYNQFRIGFWHPFGPHGKESPESIIARKREEIKSNGWTLWSFQQRRILEAWHREIVSHGEPPVFVFCSYGKSARDPDREGSFSRSVNCDRYRFVHEQEWKSFPPTIKVPHPFRPNKNTASAFIVEKIFYPVESFEPVAVQWFSDRTDNPWSSTPISTRGETMIRPGGAILMRPVRAILQLRPPFLAHVQAKPT
jgi:hypothetical protein